MSMLTLNRRAQRRFRRNVSLTVLITVTIIACATALGQYVSQVTNVDLRVTDDVVASMYLVILLLIHLLVSYVTPKTRR